MGSRRGGTLLSGKLCSCCSAPLAVVAKLGRCAKCNNKYRCRYCCQPVPTGASVCEACVKTLAQIAAAHLLGGGQHDRCASVRRLHQLAARAAQGLPLFQE